MCVCACVVILIFPCCFSGVKILWDGVSFLELTVPPKYRDNLCGLCGNFNGNRADDFFGRNGHHFETGQSFGDTWRVGGLRACSVLPRDMPQSYEPQCTQSWEAKIRSDRNCNALNSNLFTACSAKVEPSYYYNACKLDMCECPGDQCHCEVLTAYARECERAGILVHKWREATGCENVSSFSWYNNNNINSTDSNNNNNNNRSLNEISSTLAPASPPSTVVVAGEKKKNNHNEIEDRRKPVWGDLSSSSSSSSSSSLNEQHWTTKTEMASSRLEEEEGEKKRTAAADKVGEYQPGK